MSIYSVFGYGAMSGRTEAIIMGWVEVNDLREDVSYGYIYTINRFYLRVVDLERINRPHILYLRSLVHEGEHEQSRIVMTRTEIGDDRLILNGIDRNGNWERWWFQNESDCSRYDFELGEIMVYDEFTEEVNVVEWGGEPFRVLSLNMVKKEARLNRRPPGDEETPAAPTQFDITEP